ncbi:MAG: type III pantothenate kinase, partial [Candidatus Omnitrophica bacterium]|nr:type III pantothenate kinase [Candidatus Omnitrophota bacterium]
MLLAVDIGNTNITFGIFKKSKIIKKFYIPENNFNVNLLKKNIKNLDLKMAIICSVVPALTETIKNTLWKILRKKPYLIGKDIYIPIKNLYRNPSQLGQDRLINAYAGIKLYGTPLIIVDFGTAITFDIVSKDKRY